MKSFLRGWVILPRLMGSYVAVKRSVTGQSPQDGPLGVPGRRVDPESAVPATLYDLRVAVRGDTCWVPVQKIRTKWSVALTAEQHHFVRYFRDGRDSLESFYAFHQPKNRMEYVFLEGWGDDVGRLPRAVAGGEGFRLSPWSRIFARLKPKNPFIGPADDKKLLMVVDRLDRAKSSVERHGMWMAFVEPEPNFTHLLINDAPEGPDDFRVVLGPGNHRSAFLAYSGWPLIPMSPHPLFQEVRLSELENWPGVLDESFTNEEARAFFLAFFRDPHDVLLPDW